jgi:hypothetical protein
MRSAGWQQTWKVQEGHTKFSSESLKEDSHSEGVDERVLLKIDSEET